MKVLFVLPPSKFAIKERLGITGLPLGLAYLAAVLEKDKHEVRIIDAPTLSYRMSRIGDEIKKFRPQIVGLTATTSTIYEAYQLANMVKEISSSIKVIAGGPHVTFTARETLEECPYMDVVVRREGEETSEELINLLKSSPQDISFLEKVKGITFRINGKIMETEDRPFIKDLDELPFPAYHLLPMDKYKLEGKRFANIITSRGCPFSCIFCSSSELCGKTWRGRSAENVIEEIKLLSERYGVKEIEFLDDTFTLNKKRVERICDLLIKEKLNISWACSSRVDTLSEELVNHLREAGCHTIYLGIESGSQHTLDIINKGITLIQAERAIRIVKKAQLNTLGTFIIGIPGETIKTIKKTISFAKKLSPTLVQFTICTPYPGTKLFQMAKEKGWLITQDWSKYDILQPVMNIPGILTSTLSKWLMKAYLSFYLRPRFIIQQLKKRNFFVAKKMFRVVLDYLTA